VVRRTIAWTLLQHRSRARCPASGSAA